MQTSVIIDCAIVAALALFAYLGWKRGLIRTLSELLVVVLALFLANQVANAAAPEVVDRYLRPAAHEAVEQKVAALGPSGQGVSQSALEGVLDGVPFVGERAKELLEDMVFSAQEQALEGGRTLLLNYALDLTDAVLDGVVRNLVRSIIFAVCFAVLTIVLRLAVKMLNLTFSLPGLKQLNEVGGMLAGLGKGLVVVGLTVWALSLAGVLTEEVWADSLLLRLASGLKESGV
ncbi:MAG: CvpA family protein [Oscillospiraceae bacterium]|nr:CvpA family protein [Oscillospiraceae bacterium]